MKSQIFLSRGLMLCLSIAAAAATVTPAFAGFAQGNQVTMGGQPVFSIPASADGFSPDHRAWLSQDALDNALVLASNRTPSAVSVTLENGACVVLLDGRRVATADAESAKLEGLGVHELANKWAEAIRSFLADSNKTDAYLAQLTGQNPIGAVAIAERRLFAPPGTILPVAFSTPLSATCLAAGQAIEGTLTQDVVFGDYMLPAKSIVSGIVTPVGSGFAIAFNSLKTPCGTIVPINAVLTGPYAAGEAPSLVATIDMPYGAYPRYQGYTETNCRVPAQIGIGTLGGTERLVFTRGMPTVFAPGTAMSVVLETPQQVAVVVRTTRM